MLEAKGLTLRYGSRTILDNISFCAERGEICALIGANGSGKSSLLHALAGLKGTSSGEVALAGRPIGTYSRREIARQIALLPQSPRAPEGFSVAQLVSHGLFAQHGLFARSRVAHAKQVVSQALEQTGLTDFSDRPFDSLSGGEQQRVWIAMTLAQQPRLLLLDEPTSYLDMGHQLEVLSLLRGLVKQSGMGVLMVLHDINHASLFADRIVALNACRIVADGAPAEVVTADLVHNLFGARVTVLRDVNCPTPYCIPCGQSYGSQRAAN